MASQNTDVFGIYKNASQAGYAVGRLTAAGLAQRDISVLLHRPKATDGLADEGPVTSGEGAGTGAVFGGILGLLVGIGAFAIPGLGVFVAGGQFISALAGIGAVGTVGGIVGALIGMGVPHHKASRYEDRVKSGGVLLSVRCATSGEIDKAEDLLRRTGAEDITTAGEGAVSSPAFHGDATRPDGQANRL